MKEVIAVYIITGAGSKNPWTVADTVFHTLSMILIALFFISDLGVIGSFIDWFRWTLYIIYTISDVVLLGIPQAVFGIKPPHVTPSIYQSLVLQLISISFSLGLVSSFFTRLKRSLLDEETIHGTLANVANYIEKIAADHTSDIRVIDCGIVPGEVDDDDEQLSGRDVISKSNAEKNQIIQSIEINLSELEAHLDTATANN